MAGKLVLEPAWLGTIAAVDGSVLLSSPRIFGRRPRPSYSDCRFQRWVYKYSVITAVDHNGCFALRYAADVGAGVPVEVLLRTGAGVSNGQDM